MTYTRAYAKHIAESYGRTEDEFIDAIEEALEQGNCDADAMSYAICLMEDRYFPERW